MSATPTAFMQNQTRFTMPDLLSGVSYAFTKVGGIVLTVLGFSGSIGLRLLNIDLSSLATALPAFLATVAAVVIGSWFNYQKKKLDVEGRREKLALETMNALVSNGTIPPGATPDERMEILQKFRETF